MIGVRRCQEVKQLAIRRCNLLLPPASHGFRLGSPDLLAAIEQIENRRQSQRETDVIYLLSPEPHIVDCLMADFERRRYRRSTLLWTGSEYHLQYPRMACFLTGEVLPPLLRKRLDDSKVAQEQIITFQVVDIGFYPREANVVTFRDPWSFPILFHRGCDQLVKNHFASLSQKVRST